MTVSRQDDHVVDGIVVNMTQHTVPVGAVTVPGILVYNVRRRLQQLESV